MHLGTATGLFCPLCIDLLVRLSSFLVDCFVLQLVVISTSAIVGTAIISSFWIIVLVMLVHVQMGDMMLFGSLLVRELHS